MQGRDGVWGMYRVGGELVAEGRDGQAVGGDYEPSFQPERGETRGKSVRGGKGGWLRVCRVQGRRGVKSMRQGRVGALGGKVRSGAGGA
jgi:hypothetical protein